MNDWMEDLLVTSSQDLYRFKGVLAIDGWPDRFIFQVGMQPAQSTKCKTLEAIGTEVVL